MDWNVPGWEVIVELTLAVILGGICGLERERKGRGAGLRTHVLVCLGSTTAMMINEIFAENIHGLSQYSAPVDQGRAIQGILTGIGFLGAGTIINIGFANRGLTTAAMIWFTAALGIAIGSGQYAIAITGTALAMFTTVILERIEKVVSYPDRFFLKVTFSGDSDLVQPLREFVSEARYHAKMTHLGFNTAEKTTEVHLEVSTWRKRDPEGLAKSLRDRFQEIIYLEMVD